MFADDIVLVGENLEEVNKRLDEWRLVQKGIGIEDDKSKLDFVEYSLKKITKRFTEQGEQ